MGIFDDIKKKVESVDKEEIKKKAEGLFAKVNDAVSKVSDELAEKIGETNASVNQPAVQTNQQDIQNNYTETANFDEPSCREKIIQVLQSEFPEYDIAENVSPTTIGGTGKFMNYSIAVYQGQTPKLFIMIIGKTTCAHREYRWSKEEAARNHIEMINFIDHYPNKVSYITDRLHKYL